MSADEQDVEIQDHFGALARIGEFFKPLPIGARVHVQLQLHATSEEQVRAAVEAAGGIGAFKPVEHDWLTADLADHVTLTIWPPRDDDRPQAGPVHPLCLELLDEQKQCKPS